MKVAIMQPTYIGWLGYFAMIDQADTFVLMDNVPIAKKSWQTRNRIRDRQGNVHWLSIPVHAHRGQLLDTVEIDYSRDWRTKHARTIRQCYPHRDWGPYTLKRITHLSQATASTIVHMARFLGIDTPVFLASQCPETLATDRDQRIIDILHATNATSFLATPGATFLQDKTELGGIPIEWFNYTHPVYDQGQEWMSHLSVLDLIAHTNDPLSVIRQGYNPEA